MIYKYGILNIDLSKIVSITFEDKLLTIYLSSSEPIKIDKNNSKTYYNNVMDAWTNYKQSFNNPLVHDEMKRILNKDRITF